jgi:hypothetical protein
MKPRKQKLISLKRVRNKFLRAAKRDLPAIDRLAETKSWPVKPQKGKKYLMGKYFPSLEASAATSFQDLRKILALPFFRMTDY